MRDKERQRRRRNAERARREPAEPHSLGSRTPGRGAQFSEAVAQRLESTVAKLSPHEYGVVLSSVAAVYGERREDGDAPGIAPEDIADVQRLMQGFGEEVQKLDEGLRMLSAYVSRLRKRGAQRAPTRSTDSALPSRARRQLRRG